MKAQYPNLELIEYMFRQKMLGAFPALKKSYLKVSADVFLQTWPTTAGGFTAEGAVAGQAFTDEYTTVITAQRYERDASGAWSSSGHLICAVFFGSKWAYAVIDPKEAFLQDMKERNMAGTSAADKRYGVFQTLGVGE